MPLHICVMHDVASQERLEVITGLDNGTCPLLKNVKQKACQASVVWVVSHNQAVLDTALYQYYVSTFMHCKGTHPGHDYQSQAS